MSSKELTKLTQNLSLVWLLNKVEGKINFWWAPQKILIPPDWEES
jgi:hypothetical protein